MTGEPITSDVLIADAQELGFPATERLIQDWERRGFLAKRTRRSLGYGRGQEKGIWPEAQRDIWHALVTNRLKLTSRGGIAVLANVPVWSWLVPDVEAIPVDQVRRALTTWIEAERKRPWKASLNAAEQVVAQLVDPALSRSLHARLARDLAPAVHSHQLNDDDISGLSMYFDPAKLGRVVGTTGAQLTPESWGEVTRQRLEAARSLPELDDAYFWYARFSYRESLHRYLSLRPSFEKDASDESKPLFRPLTSDEITANACRDLLSNLALTANSPP